MMGTKKEKSLQAFENQQNLVRQQMESFVGKNPFAMMSELAESNLEIWESMTGQKLNSYTKSSGKE